MPNAVVKSYAKKTGKSPEHIEGWWKEAEKEAKKKFPKKGPHYWAYVNGIVKRRGGIKEVIGFRDFVDLLSEEDSGEKESALSKMSKEHGPVLDRIEKIKDLGRTFDKALKSDGGEKSKGNYAHWLKTTDKYRVAYFTDTDLDIETVLVFRGHKCFGLASKNDSDAIIDFKFVPMERSDWQAIEDFSLDNLDSSATITDENLDHYVEMILQATHK